MYQGNAKESGGIVGRVEGVGLGHALELNDAQDMVGAEESMIGFDEEGREVIITAHLNPNNGDVAWLPSYNLEDLKNKTVAMSQMTSMLRDTDRNRVFEEAIRVAIHAFVEKHQRRPVVLDIGCGTSLLSLFAAKHGAEYVFAVEMFDSMAAIAEKVVAANNLQDKIIVIQGKSTDITQLPCEVDIIISELLDSALLGESCLPSHSDAINRFLRKDEVNTLNNPFAVADRIIPNRGEILATLIESSEVRSMVQVDCITAGREPFMTYRNESARQCRGGWPMIPIHWEALQYRGARKLSDAIPCLQVSFADTHHNIYFNMMTNPELSGRQSIPQSSDVLVAGNHPIKSYDTEIQVKEEGTVNGVMFWWNTYLLSSNLNPMNTLCYSTEPGRQNWQDHWQQIIYPLPEPIHANSGDIIVLHVSHDDLSFWVNVEKLSSHSLPVSPSGLFSSPSAGTATTNRTVGLKRNRDANNIRSLQNMVPRYYEERLDAKHSCTCGWHLLNGCFQFLYHNSFIFNKQWDDIFDACVDYLIQYASQLHQNYYQRQNVSSNSPRSSQPPPAIVLDVSDGSVLSLSFAVKMRKKLATIQSNNHQPVASSPDTTTAASSFIHFISKERKQFSGIFYSQLVEVNQIEDLVSVWDGDFEELPGLLDAVATGTNSMADDEMTEDVVPTVSSTIAPEEQFHSIPKIPLLIHNCFSYQLQSLPVWEAISFYYQRIALQPFLDPQAIILPGKALIMAMPLSLPELKNCHGLVHQVCGFDHTPLDQRQEQWHQYLYPYRLANYRKRALASPAPIAIIDYQQLAVQNIHQITQIAIETEGECDGIAIWVDYHLPNIVANQPYTAIHSSPPKILSPYQQNDFLPFMTQSIKFLEQSRYVQVSNCVQIEVYFELGQSDFQYHMEIV